MKIIEFDQGYLWDDPNLRLGDPSYLLEPGDPGYVPPATPINQPPTKRKRMKRNTYFPTRAADQITWLVNFANKLPGYAATVGLTPAQSAAAVADALWLVYVLQSWLGAARAFALACTDAATEAQTGDGSALMVLPVFTPPALPAGVVAVNTGALDRILSVASDIKGHSGFTEAIGTDLGVIGPEKGAPDFATLAPAFKVTRTPAGVNVGWGWGGNAEFLDMIELQVDRGDGQGWVMLAYDTTPGYTDTFAQPSALTKWKYRGIYRVGDQRVGQWSAEQTVTVGG
jgi:hypothetical protein